MVVTDVKLLPNRIKEPSMGVDFFLIFCLENKNDLDWD